MLNSVRYSAEPHSDNAIDCQLKTEWIIAIVNGIDHNKLQMMRSRQMQVRHYAVKYAVCSNEQITPMKSL